MKLIICLFLSLYANFSYSAPLDDVINELMESQESLIIPIKVGKTTIFISAGSGIPPDPGLEGNKTIKGIDSDNDGIRDDVERKIGIHFKNDPEKRAYHYFLAMKYQALINAPNNKSINNQASKELFQANSCMRELHFNDGEEHGYSFVAPIVMNTYARLDAYVESLQLGSGEIRSTLGLKECGE